MAKVQLGASNTAYRIFNTLRDQAPCSSTNTRNRAYNRWRKL
ncbi:MAG: hypothetical protein AAF750_03575 [Planctomycetota bacterium]